MPRTPSTTTTNPRAKRTLRSTPQPSVQEVIVLSSDDECNLRPSQPLKKSKRPKPPPVPSTEVVDISSDDNAKTTTTGESTRLAETISHLRSENAKLIRENQKLRNAAKPDVQPQPQGSQPQSQPANDQDRLSREQLRRQIDQCKKKADLDAQKLNNEIAVLRRTGLRFEGKLPVNQSDMEDATTCEICSCTMWKPFILACSHSFCESCLEDWFSTTLKNHLNAHPNAAALYNRPDFHTIIHDPRYIPFIRSVPQPEYTCPHCRCQAKLMPVENLALKNIVRIAGAANGESSPAKGKQPAGAANNHNVWARFFPALP